jgi:hypothetical protein
MHIFIWQVIENWFHGVWLKLNEPALSNKNNSSGKAEKPSRKKRWKVVSWGLIATFFILSGFLVGFLLAFSWGETSVWDRIRATEDNLLELYANSTQTDLEAWLPDSQMNFTDGLIWESQLLSFNQDRPDYQNVIQVLENGKGACGEFVWVFGAFCVANKIPFRVVTVGYFAPNVVDHAWAQVNPSHDGETWIHVEVTDSCALFAKGNITDQLWNLTINNNAYYAKRNYKMILAFELNENEEVVITDVTSTFSAS